MSDDLAEHCGINRGAPSRIGVPAGTVVGTEPELKREMRRYCSDMCMTPNGLVHMFLGQVATLTYLQAKPVPEGFRERNGLFEFGKSRGEDARNRELHTRQRRHLVDRGSFGEVD